MNKYLIIFFISFNIYSQENKKQIYVDSNQDYCLLIENTTSVSKKNVEGVDMDVFLNLKENTFNYTTIISKINNHNFRDGNLLDENYEKFIKENCNCEIIDSEIVLYNNLKSLRYKIKTQKDKNIFIGYIDSFVSNTLLYNVVFMAFQNNFDNVKAKYIDSMNTLIINGKTTIDSNNP
jgi:hypothetical protein